jgi:hypothetical protein
VDAGAELAGPETAASLGAHWGCTMGLACEVPLSGQGLNATNAIIAITSGNCGDDAPTIADATWTPTSRTADVSGQTFSFSLGTPTVGLPGDHFKLCWAANPQKLNDFRVELDDVFSLVGPYTNDYTCSLGTNCQLRLSGWGLSQPNELVVILGGECGDAYSFYGGGVSPSGYAQTSDDITTRANGSAVAVYGLGTPFGVPSSLLQEGQAYKLCWAHEPQGRFPMTLAQFNVEVDGDFLMDVPPDWHSQGAQTWHDDETGMDFMFFNPNGRRV